MNEALTRILEIVPAAFFRAIEEETVASFYQAHQLTTQRYDAPEQIGMLGQNRHAFCEAAFRRVARNIGLETHASETMPRGGHYSWVSINGIHLLRANVQTHCGTPRPTHFRRAWAALNAWLSPLQFNLLSPTIEPSKDEICGMLVVSAYKNSQGRDPAMPAFIGLGIPSSDLSSWLTLQPIHSILALYHDKQTQQLTPREEPIEIPDRAIPLLKKGPRGGSVG